MFQIQVTNREAVRFTKINEIKTQWNFQAK